MGCGADAGLFHYGAHYGILVLVAYDDEGYVFFGCDGDAEELGSEFGASAFGVDYRAAARARGACRVHDQLHMAALGYRNQ